MDNLPDAPKFSTRNHHRISMTGAIFLIKKSFTGYKKTNIASKTDKFLSLRSEIKINRFDV